MRLAISATLSFLTAIAILTVVENAAAAQRAGEPDSLSWGKFLWRIAGETDSSAASPELIDQKSLLLQSYLASAPAKDIETKGDSKAKALLAEAQQLLADAQAARKEGQYEAAGTALDNGLKILSAALARVPKAVAARRKGEGRSHFEELWKQIDSYLQRLPTAMAEQRARGDVDQEIKQIEGMMAEAQRLASAKRYGEGNKLLAEVYQVTVNLVSRLRQGETVVSSLNFATAAEEFAYETKRNDSYRILIKIMVSDGEVDQAALRELTDGYVEQSQKLRSEAEAQASAGQEAEAIETMEKSTSWLIRALRAGGLYVPE